MFNIVAKFTIFFCEFWPHMLSILLNSISGPRLFLSCPSDPDGSQVWFTDLWNYSVVPYLLEAVREGLQLYGRRAPWEDPTLFICQTYPWTGETVQGGQEALLRLVHIKTLWKATTSNITQLQEKVFYLYVHSKQRSSVVSLNEEMHQETKLNNSRQINVCQLCWITKLGLSCIFIKIITIHSSSNQYFWICVLLLGHLL